MADITFNGRFVPQSSVQINATDFDVEADFFDGLGMFSALDVQAGDLVYLDCFASFTAPGTVCRYEVITVNSATPFTISCRIRFNDLGTVIDPAEVSGSAGFISRSTPNKRMPFYASPTVHTISDYVIQYARNNDIQYILDPWGYKYVKNGPV